MSSVVRTGAIAVLDPAKLDRVGMVASFACAIHCGAAALVASASGMLENPRIELVLLVIAIGVAGTALLGGYRRHRSWAPVLAGVLATTVLVLAKTLDVEAFEQVGSVVGGLALVAAHWLNLRAGKCALGCCR